MARIRQEDIEAVKERTDIVALVGQYLTLKKSGHDSLTGLCPFHQEKTGSFSVSPSKQVFYCFGCGKGGDAITFLRELEHLSYVEAIERLAGVAGVSLRFEGDSPAERRKAERRKALYRANEQAAELFVDDAARREGGRRRARLPDGARHHARRAGRVPGRATRPGTPTSCCGASAATATCPPRCCSKRVSPRAATTARCAIGSAVASRSRSTICRGASSGSARASCPRTHARASRRSTSTPRRRRSTASTRCSTTCIARVRRWPRPARCSWSRATPT